MGICSSTSNTEGGINDISSPSFSSSNSGIEQSKMIDKILREDERRLSREVKVSVSLLDNVRLCRVEVEAD